MKILFDLFPVLLFFVAYRVTDIYTATLVAIGATIAQIAWAWFVRRKVDAMMWFTLVVVVVFGGLTIALHNPTFIKWKPTILYWGMGLGMLVATLAFKRNAIRSMLGSQIELPDAVWSRLNFSWAGFFVAMGAINLFVAYHFSESTWVNFKLFGGIGLMILFVFAQSLMLSRYIGEEEKK
ncbi:septation protein A [Niveibacterium sp. SC-1]|uniref:septation protein A n=1 Tax=Niveibacterium sp. SC-1 TaxID=3135646 RepID=UPI00311DD3F1